MVEIAEVGVVWVTENELENTAGEVGVVTTTVEIAAVGVVTENELENTAGDVGVVTTTVEKGALAKVEVTGAADVWLPSSGKINPTLRGKQITWTFLVGLEWEADPVTVTVGNVLVAKDVLVIDTVEEIPELKEALVAKDVLMDSLDEIAELMEALVANDVLKDALEEMAELKEMVGATDVLDTLEIAELKDALEEIPELKEALEETAVLKDSLEEIPKENVVGSELAVAVGKKDVVTLSL